MKKYIKWVILLVCLFIFCFIAVNVYNNNVIVSDSVIYNFINEYIISKEITPIVKVITNIGDTICIIIIAIISLLFFKDKKINMSIIVNLVIVTILNNILKLIFKRPRPDLDALVTETSYSFPSGHSMISMAFYGYFIYLIYKYVENKMIKWGIISILSIVILLIGISRVYLGVHYVTDVISGFCFSISYLIIYTSIMKKIIYKELLADC